MARDVLAYSIGNAASTTLTDGVSNSATSMTITSDTNFAAKSGEGMVIIDEDQDTEELAYATGKTSNTLAIPLANRGLEGGSAQAHAASASIKGILTAAMWNDMIDALTNVLSKTTGALDTTKVVDLTTAQTLTNKVITYADNTLTNVAGTTATQTLTNKRITKRETTEVSSATPTINTDNCDIYTLTALATGITSFTSGLSGTPTDGQTLLIRIQDSGSGQTITWGASFESAGATLPTSITAGKKAYIGLMYNADDSKWDCVAAIEEA